jgi:uncharacterized protein (TIGR03118 family)
MALVTDPNLINPWGVSFGPNSPFWISDNNAGVSTLYDGAGTPQPLVVNIPLPAGAAGTAAPTGTVFNDSGDFVVSLGGRHGAALFIFATEDGTISAWNPNVDPTHAILEVDNSAVPNAANGAVYKGLAIGSNATGNFLFAANFRAGTIDVFDKNFHKVTLAGTFTDAQIPAGFAPFDVQNIGGKLYVTYAMQNASKHDDVGGAGNGFVDVFDTNGNLLQRLVAHGPLNSPWGLAIAPAGFGNFGGDLLVGNFRDGHINAFDPNTGMLVGTLTDQNGQPVTISGLWSLTFRSDGAADPNTLFFTAGIQGEQHGLFGSLQAETANQRFVAQVYQDLLHRAVDPSGFSFWSGLLNQGISRAQVVLGIESSMEFRTDQVMALYNQFLHRAVDPSGLATFTNFLAQGGTVEQVATMLVGSPEYFMNRGGGTNDGFLNALYQDGLRRAVDPSGRATFGTALANGMMSPGMVAAAVFSSLEFRQDVVQGFYQSFLHRAADMDGLNVFTQSLMQGATDQEVTAAIVGSDEFFAKV